PSARTVFTSARTTCPRTQLEDCWATKPSSATQRTTSNRLDERCRYRSTTSPSAQSSKPRAKPIPLQRSASTACAPFATLSATHNSSQLAEFLTKTLAQLSKQAPAP